MCLGVAPVIISDEWVPVRGIKWDECSLIVKERDIQYIDSIVSSYEDSYEEMGRAARKYYEKYFSDQALFNFIIDSCEEIQRSQILPEAFYWKMRYSKITCLALETNLRRAKNKLRYLIKSSKYA